MLIQRRRLLLVAVGLLGSYAVGFAAGAEGSRPPLPDAAVTFTARGSDLRAGDKIRLAIVVRNDGAAPMPPVPVALTADGRRYAEWMLPKELPPGGSAEWRTTFVGVRGMHLLSVAVDPFDDVVEASKSNNTASLSIGLADARAPFPWLALLFGALFFVLGMGAGGLLRRPDSVRSRPRRKAAARPRR